MLPRWESAQIASKHRRQVLAAVAQIQLRRGWKAPAFVPATALGSASLPELFQYIRIHSSEVSGNCDHRYIGVQELR